MMRPILLDRLEASFLAFGFILIGILIGVTLS